MPRPRIAHVLNTIGLGGVPEACFHLLRELPRERYDCRVYVLRRASDEEGARGGRLGRFAEIGVPVSFSAQGEDKMALVGELAAWLVGQEIDLLHTHSYKPNLYGRLAGLLCQPRGLRLLAHYHNQYDNKWASDGKLVFDRRLAEFPGALVACSRSVAGHVAERIGVPAARIDVVPNGVEAERFARGDRCTARAQLGIGDDRIVVGLVGRISEQKGQEEFIRAAAIVRARFPAALFLVIGSADTPNLLAQAKDLVAELGVADSVRFTGHVADMPSLYASLDVLAAPSRWEGFGLMLVEAMAAGKPIVATRVGAIPEVCGGDTALLVPPCNPPALAEALLALLADPVRAQAMGRAGAARAGEYSWRRSGALLEGIYERVLA
ncbi:MAG: glycosyltransferase [Betaproteobacteria bacterium]|nr:glycosyltransferase [Betaproteobacteria bacterium]